MPEQLLLPTKIDAYNTFDGGIADYEKGGQQNEQAFERSVNYRANPKEITLLSKTTKESGSIVTDLPVDGDRVGTDLYYYGNTGNIYKRTTAGSHSLLRGIASSTGNGMKYYTEDDFLYYTSDKVIGRYGQISGTPTFVDDFLGSEGGVPLNTNALDLEASSSQYASRADTASLSITGDLSIECSIKPESLPAVGSSMVLFSKWDVNTNIRSYKFEIYGISGYFGDGGDGAVTVSTSDVYDSGFSTPLIDAACTATAGTPTISATNASFAADQEILIHQSRGSGAGTWERRKILSYTAGTITTTENLTASYVTGAQVLVLNQFTSFTVNSGVTLTAKAWDGSTGGILAFLANGTVTVTGTITTGGPGPSGGFSTEATGFRGGSVAGGQGEGTAGDRNGVNGAANGNGGGGAAGGTTGNRSGAGAGGHSVAGSNGSGNGGTPGTGGTAVGVTDLTTMNFGGGGGCASGSVSASGGFGGYGGGIVFISGATITVTGSIKADGTDGQVGGDTVGPGGAGGGGSILLKVQTATLGTSLVLARAGVGGSGGGGNGGNGADGRIHLDYYTSYTGTTDPTLSVVQDNTLVTNTSYQLRLGISSNGTAEEFLARQTTITTSDWFHVAVTWDASESTATFYQGGVSLGTSVGTATSINDNASTSAIGADFNSSAQNFYDGLIDEVRVWNTIRTVSQIIANKGTHVADNATGLVAYYQLNGDYTDTQTAGNNDLTASGSPVFTTDVPFAAPTTRVDLDQSLDTSGQTYTLSTSISEGSTHRQTFVPAKDPQKSIEVLVAAIGTGDWTITVHDSLNRSIATATVTNANMATGDYEFTFSSVWRPIVGASYHFHLTSTVADGTVTTTTLNDLETVDFHTYYQFLVEDIYHPISQVLNFIAIGNERYVATYAADGTYNPHRLSFPSGWRVRCITKWKGFWAFGCWKGTNIYDVDDGMIFLWDGVKDTYNDTIPIPEGGINALFSSRGVLFIWAGYHGDMLEYRGGDYAEPVKRVPKMAESKRIEILPKAVSMWDGLLRWGVAGDSNSSDVERGVYTWGKRKNSNQDSLSYDYPISTGSRATTNVKIGFTFAIDQKLLIGFKDNISYGMDVVDPTGSPFATGTIEFPIRDYGRVSKEKKALLVRADFIGLASGESIKLKYKLDRDASWVEGKTSKDQGYTNTVGDEVARLPIPYGNIKELQIACDMATTGSTSPKVIEVSLEIDPKVSDRAF